ncbi:MAG TPA: squalene synthase HpnC [Gaiellaceae bacterium]|nr:squalene synthase HpnC [Gaiellaceae bacterium]
MTAPLAAAPDIDSLLRKSGGENFTVAPAFVGRAARAHLDAIYGFARLVDDLGDELHGDRLAALEWLEGDLDRAFAGDPEHPLMRTLAATIRALRLPRDPFARLIEANRVDQTGTGYETFDQLVGYCHLSADPVGELVLHVFGAATPERVALSDLVCTALQLVEHWQDVGEDAARGRVYLPAEDRRLFGVEDAELRAGGASYELRALLAYECERARKLLDDGARLVGTLGGRARLAVAGYVGGGRAALDTLRRAGYQVLPRAPRAPRAAIARAALATCARGR